MAAAFASALAARLVEIPDHHHLADAESRAAIAVQGLTRERAGADVPAITAHHARIDAGERVGLALDVQSASTPSPLRVRRSGEAKIETRPAFVAIELPVRVEPP